MLEKMPHALGAALSGVRAGIDKTLYHEAFRDAPTGLVVTSAAFPDGGAMPARLTADGPGLSPPLAVAGLPAGTGSLVLVVEDPDAPAIEPLVHLIAWPLPPGVELAEGDLAGPAGPGAPHALGRNSFLKDAWLPPDPPTGHGPHRYLFQAYAVDGPLDLGESPGRGALVEALRGRVLAKGLLTGTYERA